jgi:hypothetical protein
LRSGYWRRGFLRAFAYVALDGTPPVLSTWFHWTGELLAMPTSAQDPVSNWPVR